MDAGFGTQTVTGGYKYRWNVSCVAISFSSLLESRKRVGLTAYYIATVQRQVNLSRYRYAPGAYGDSAYMFKTCTYIYMWQWSLARALEWN